MQKATTIFPNPPSIVTSAAVGGKMEHEGPYGGCFDKINDDPYFTTDTFEKGESQLQKQAVRMALEKANLKEDDIDVLIGGDLLDQCVGTTYAATVFRFSGSTQHARPCRKVFCWHRCSPQAVLRDLLWLSPHHTSAQPKGSTACPSITAVSVPRLPSGLPQQAVRWQCPPKEKRPMYVVLQ